MTPSWMNELIGFCVKWVGVAVVRSKTTFRATVIANISVAQSILDLIGNRSADDLGQVKDSLLRKIAAEADIAVAEAQKKLAEAAESSNIANLRKRHDKFAQAELDARRLANARSAAEIEAIKSDAKMREVQAIAEAKARIIEAISKLKQEGGAAFFDADALARMLQLPDSQDPGDQ